MNKPIRIIVPFTGENDTGFTPGDTVWTLVIDGKPIIEVSLEHVQEPTEEEYKSPQEAAMELSKSRDFTEDGLRPGKYVVDDIGNVLEIIHGTEETRKL